jgi:hypothetical protein
VNGHAWGPKFRCMNEGCAIIRHASRPQWWRRGWGHSKWVRTRLPKCKGAASPHKWQDEANGLRVCQRDGCALLFDGILGAWKRPGSLKWQRIKEQAIPSCRGVALHAAPSRCSHVERAPVALGVGQSVTGGIKIGQCERPALPRLVVCELHAEPEAVRIVMRSMATEIERLKMEGP